MIHKLYSQVMIQKVILAEDVIGQVRLGHLLILAQLCTELCFSAQRSMETHYSLLHQQKKKEPPCSKLFHYLFPIAVRSLRNSSNCLLF